MTRNNSEGKPCRILPGTAERLTKAFEVLGIDVAIKQTATTLTINGTKFTALKSYETWRAIEFDNKVEQAIRSVLDSNDVSTEAMNITYDKVVKQIEDLQPGKLYEMGMGLPTLAKVAEYERKAKAVVDFLNDPVNRTFLAQYEARKSLLDRKYDEVVKD